MESGCVFLLGLGAGAWHDQAQQVRASSLNRAGRKASSIWAGKGGDDHIPWPTKEGYSSHGLALGGPTLKGKHNHAPVTKRMGRKFKGKTQSCASHKEDGNKF